ALLKELQADPKAPNVISRIAYHHERLARFDLTLGWGDEALAHARQCVKLRQDLLSEALASAASAKNDLAVGHRWLGTILFKMGFKDEAVVQFDEVLRLRKELAEANKKEVRYTDYLSDDTRFVADKMIQWGDPQRARERAMQALSYLGEA